MPTADDHSFALVLNDVFKRHDTGHGHPERPARYDAVSSGVNRADALDHAVRIEAQLASLEHIALCHGEDYIEMARRDIESGLPQLSTGDTDVSLASFEVARLAVGSVIATVDAVLNGSAQTAFCALRPPGHHARPNQGMGFCVFNNIAIGARYAQQQYGIERVLIADWDVHHGNGTQDIFYDDPSVFFFSTHQSPWYPGTGARSETGSGAAVGTNMNRPFPAGSGREQVLGAFRDDLVPAARAFQPDLVMISAGFDSRIGDPLGNFTLDDDDFVELTEIMRDLADTTAQGRVISLLEGGYDLEGLAAAVEAHVGALL
ncbi:MAG: histone deacetylase [Acidobacteria bacterium]|nr:histone deacetylase [Acidobacteriota bacterium]MDA1236342.1 histone deacetylase [Acidobacteriota bacterium]